jgi:hypothetical protein
MTAAIYVRAQATALRLLTKFGQTVTLRSYTAGTYDPATGKATPTRADTSRHGAKLGFGENQTTVRGNLIEVEDTRLLLDASAAAPSVHDHFIIQGTEYKIVSIADTNLAGTPCIYDIHLRVGA